MGVILACAIIGDTCSDRSALLPDRAMRFASMLLCKSCHSALALALAVLPLLVVSWLSADAVAQAPAKKQTKEEVEDPVKPKRKAPPRVGDEEDKPKNT